jgi:hypothetical protein
MKKYSTPNLTVHGSVESITQILGAENSRDFLFFSGGTTAINANGPVTTGSYDADITAGGLTRRPR